MTTSRTIGIDHTEKMRRPSLWERGGAGCNTGNATIITSPDGTAYKPYFIRKSGDRVGDNRHALVPLEVGSWIISADWWRKREVEIEIEVTRVTSIEGDHATIDVVEVCNQGGWQIVNDNDVPDGVRDAICAARAKATCYHCRNPHFVSVTEAEIAAACTAPQNVPAS